MSPVGGILSRDYNAGQAPRRKMNDQDFQILFKPSF